VRFDIVTLFPTFFDSPLASGVIGRAIVRQIATVYCVNPRDFTEDKHKRVDDEPYGGGVGMVIKPEPMFAAVESLPVLARRETILLTPQGMPMNQALFRQLGQTCEQIVLLCGCYEGIDERVTQLVTREVSLGDFVLTGGEIPALALINGVTRLLPGTIGKRASHEEDSFENGLLDYPHYTRPPVFRGQAVPEVLLSGDHAAIAQWRYDQQLQRTRERRPDLLERDEATHSSSNPCPNSHPDPNPAPTY